MQVLELQVDVDRALSPDELGSLESSVRDEGLDLISLYQDAANTIHIQFWYPETQGVGFLPLWGVIAIIAAVPVAILAWRLFNIEPMDWVPFLAIMGMMALGGYTIYKAAMR